MLAVGVVAMAVGRGAGSGYVGGPIGVSQMCQPNVWVDICCLVSAMGGCGGSSHVCIVVSLGQQTYI